ncbi:hypothetical protein PI126_g21064 [Phytophthora idaei]|nr:hypothetical protein PI126_g21064 [Phytophthora idaei]
MVWGCITYEGVGALHLCESSVTGAYYKSILEKNLHTTISVMGIGEDYMSKRLQQVQDNFGGHTKY